MVSSVETSQEKKREAQRTNFMDEKDQSLATADIKKILK